MSSNQKLKEDYELNVLAVFAAILGGGLIVADLLGRLRDLFVQEWPYISWGLVILLSAVAIGIVQFVTNANRIFRLDQHWELIQALQQSLEELSKANQEKAKSIERSTERQFKELNESHRKQWIYINNAEKKLEELLKQKGPVALPAIAPESETTELASVVSQITGGNS